MATYRSRLKPVTRHAVSSSIVTTCSAKRRTGACALYAATADAADAMRIGDTIGRLQAGYGADLLVMRGRPWERIEDLRLDNIVAVISRGALVRGTLPRTAV